MRLHGKKNYYALDLLSRFSCVGSDCSYHCCRGWVVGYDEPSYIKLKKSINKHSQEYKFFKKNIKITHGDDPFHFAKIKLRADGICSYLNDDGLCSIQIGHGASCLSSICSNFPKEVSYLKDKVEITASLGCPEIVRLALFEKSTANKLIVADASIVRDDSPVKQSISDVSKASQYLQLRSLVEDLLSKNDYNYELIAFALGFAVHKYISDGRSKGIDEYLTEHLINDCTALFTEDDSGNEFSVSVISGVLVTRENVSGSELTQLFEDIVMQHVLSQEQQTVTVDMQAMLRDYVEVKRFVEVQHKSVINTIFDNYIINYLTTVYCANDERLYKYIYILVLRLSVLKFLVYLTLARKFDVTQEGAQLIEDLPDTVVDVVTRFSRAVGHMKGFFERTYDELAKNNEAGIAQLAALVKF